MNRVFVIAGHSVTSQGAKGYDGEMEYLKTKELQQAVVDELLGKAVEVITDRPEQTLREVVDFLNIVMQEGDLAIDIHFNNNNPSATGTEIFIHKDSPQFFREIAARVVNAVADAQGLKVRRYVRSRDYKYPHESARGTLALIDKVFVEDKPATVMLVEVCFMNQSDMEKYDKEKVAKALVKALELPDYIGDLDPKTEKTV